MMRAEFVVVVEKVLSDVTVGRFMLSPLGGRWVVVVLVCGAGGGFVGFDAPKTSARFPVVVMFASVGSRQRPHDSGALDGLALPPPRQFVFLWPTRAVVAHMSSQ
jgi:hypothetical protein